MRIRNSLRNAIIGVFYYLVTFFIGFIARSIFINILGDEYNGLNSLFTNIVTILSIAELGIGSAIVYHLYKPIAENDKETIKSLMKLYKKAYLFIALIIFILAMILLPFLPYIVGSTTVNNIYLIFILYVMSTVCSYLFTYNRSIIIAHQENYIITICDIVYKLGLNIAQILVLLITKNYIIYLIMQIIFVILENLVITVIAYKKYPYLREKEVKEISSSVTKDIFLKVKGLLYYKIGSSIISSTDNIIITRFSGLKMVGLYSNYTMIMIVVNCVLSQAVTSITASIGNLLATSSREKCHNIYKKIIYLQYFVNNTFYILLFNLTSPFIEIWLGKNYLLPTVTLFFIVLVNYNASTGLTIRAFKEAAGIYHEDRYIPLIEAILNIILSIILANFLGIVGCLLGTILSSMITYIYDYPVYVYKKIFNKKIICYYLELIKYIIMFIISFVLCYIGCFKLINYVDSLIILIIVRGLICIVINIFIFFIFTNNTIEYNFYLNFLKKALNNFLSKI